MSTATLSALDLAAILVRPSEPPTDASVLTADIEALHLQCCREMKKTYLDPPTGYTVMTAYAHATRGVCCGSRCRHCCFGHFKYQGERTKRIHETTLLRVAGKHNCTPAVHAKGYKKAVFLDSSAASGGASALSPLLETLAHAIADGRGVAASDRARERASASLLVVTCFDPATYHVTSLAGSHDSAAAPIYLNAVMDLCLAAGADLLAVAAPSASSSSMPMPESERRAFVVAECERVLERPVSTAGGEGAARAPETTLPLLMP